MVAAVAADMAAAGTVVAGTAAVDMAGSAVDMLMGVAVAAAGYTPGRSSHSEEGIVAT